MLKRQLLLGCLVGNIYYWDECMMEIVCLGDEMLLITESRVAR